MQRTVAYAASVLQLNWYHTKTGQKANTHAWLHSTQGQFLWVAHLHAPCASAFALKDVNKEGSSRWGRPSSLLLCDRQLSFLGEGLGGASFASSSSSFSSSSSGSRMRVTSEAKTCNLRRHRMWCLFSKTHPCNPYSGKSTVSTSKLRYVLADVNVCKLQWQ